MAQDLLKKKLNFVSRYTQATEQFLTLMATIKALSEEWGAEGYATGSTHPITDADLQNAVGSGQPPFPHLSASVLSNLDAAHTAIRTTFDLNRGKFEDARA